MKYAVLFVAFLAMPAHAQFLGGAAEGIRSANEYDLQRRALELDALDGGSRYRRLRTEQQLDAIQRQLKENADLLENLERTERQRRYLRGY